MTVFDSLLSADDSDDAVAQANADQLTTDALRAAQHNAILQLPSGTIFLGKETAAALVLDERHSGLTIQGNCPAATLLANRMNYLPVLHMLSTRIPYFSAGSFTAGNSFITVTDAQGFATYNEDDVVFFWAWNNGTSRSERQRLLVTTKNPTTHAVNLSGAISTTIAPTNFKHIINGIAASNAAPAGTTELEIDPARTFLLQVGDDIVVTDGPAANLVFAEWARVKAIDSESDPAVVTLDRPLLRSYAEGLVCIVPPPHMTDITIRDLSIAVSKSTESLAFGYAETGVRIRLENVDFVQGPEEGGIPGDFGFNNVGDLRLINCSTLGSFGFNACQLVFADGIKALHGVGGEEYCTEMYFSHLSGGGFKFTSNETYGGAQACSRVFLTDSVLNGATYSQIALPDESAFVNVQIVNFDLDNPTIPVYLNANNSSLINVISDRKIQFVGQNWRVAMLTAPAVSLINYPYAPYTEGTGIFLTPLLPDPTQVTDSTDPGNWRVAFLAFTDGNIASSQVQTPSGSPTTVVGKLPIHDDDDGSLIGYIPIYEDF